MKDQGKLRNSSRWRLKRCDNTTQCGFLNFILYYKNIVKKDIIGATGVLGIWPIEQATVLFDVTFPEFVNSTVLIQYSCSSEVHNEVLRGKEPGACNILPNGSKNTVHIIYRYRRYIDR